MAFAGVAGSRHFYLLNFIKKLLFGVRIYKSGRQITAWLVAFAQKYAKEII